LAPVLRKAQTVTTGPELAKLSGKLVPQEGFEPPTHALRMPTIKAIT